MLLLLFATIGTSSLADCFAASCLLKCRTLLYRNTVNLACGCNAQVKEVGLMIDTPRRSPGSTLKERKST